MNPDNVAPRSVVPPPAFSSRLTPHATVPPAPPPRPPASVRPQRVDRWSIVSAPPAVQSPGFALPTIPFLRDSGLALLILTALALAGMVYLYSAGRQQVTISINEQEVQLWTRGQTVKSVLQEAGISWNVKDIIRPALESPLPANGRISIRPALPVVIEADGDVLQKRTQANTVEAVLNENNIRVKSQDVVLLDGRPVSFDTRLGRSTATRGHPAMPAETLGPMHLSVARAVPIQVNDNGTALTIYTTENTLGNALARAGILIYVGDEVAPDLTTPVSAGASVFIRRSRPATVTVDGRTIKTRTREETVAGLLAQEGIQLEGQDYVNPPLETPIADNLAVTVTRLRIEYYTETETLPFETKWLPDSNLELDQRVIADVGQKGIKKRLFKTVYRDGKLESQGLEREWIEQAPRNHIINYGTKVVVRDLTLPDGSVVQYWRKIRVLATSYTAASSGKEKEHPEYGKTRLGLDAGRGVVAVDPRVINLRSTVYVPGYGLALAGDTGGRIKGRHIDLGFAEDNYELWYRWVDVYVLTPVPPKSQINLVLADYPVEGGVGR